MRFSSRISRKEAKEDVRLYMSEKVEFNELRTEKLKKMGKSNMDRIGLKRKKRDGGEKVLWTDPQVQLT